MEIKLNKDLQKMESRLAFGLTGRQFLFSAVGAAVGAGLYYTLYKNGVSTDISAFICLAVVAPLGALGFYNYHGLTFEQLICVWIRQFFLCPQVLVSRLENDFYERDKAKITEAEIKEAHRND